MSLDVIDLDALVKPIARIKLLGEHYDVLPASGRAAELLDSVAQVQQLSPEDRKARVATLNLTDIQREIVAEAVPTFPIEKFPKLNVDQINAIIALATKQQDKVRELIAEHEKNVGGP